MDQWEAQGQLETLVLQDFLDLLGWWDLKVPKVLLATQDCQEPLALGG
jgi:hypothetical protein